LLQACVGRLMRDARGNYLSYHFAALASMAEGDLTRASQALERGHRLGMPDDEYASLREALDDARPRSERVLPIAGWVAALWGSTFVLLFVLGTFLSRAALRASRRAPARGSGEFVGLDRRLRRTYRVVLWLSCAFYYASIPLVLLAVLGLGAAFLYGSIQLGRVPVNLLALVAVTVFVTL